MEQKYSGTFTVIDGLDGIGKGTVQAAIINYIKKKKLRILDLHDYWNKHHIHPEFMHKMEGGEKNPFYVDLDSFDVLVTSEPTRAGIGRMIRREITADNKRQYSAHMTARMFAADRMTFYKRVILPALKNGKHIIQSRSVSTSIVYQPMQELLPHEPALPMKTVLKIEGNDFALNNAPNLLIIPTISNVEELMERLGAREKKDNCEFETAKFQGKIKPLYESEKLRYIFESRGCKVAYLDAGISVVKTEEQAVEIFKETFPNI